MDDFSQFIMGGQPKAPPPQANPVANQGNLPVVTDAILDSLKRTESGKQKFALNKESGAMGDYQFIPSTVKMLHEQGYEFNPFNPKEAREAARHYLTKLVKQTGSLEGALSAYGGHVTKDPKPYINKVLGGATQTNAEPTDDFSSFLKGGTAPEGAQAEQEVGATKQRKVNPASALKGAEFFATGGALMPKEVRQQGGELAKSVTAFLDNTVGSVLPFGAKQIGYLFGRTIGDSPETAEKISNRMASIVDKPFGKAFGLTNDSAYKNEATGKLFEFIGENVGKGSQWIADKTGLPKSDIEWMINTALPKVTEVVGTKVSKTGGKAIDELKADFEKLNEKAGIQPKKSPQITEVIVDETYPQGAPKAPVEGAPVVAPEAPKAPVERAIVVPEEMPVNRAETSPFTPDELNAREALLNKIGLDEVRTSALNANPKESASQFITSQADQGPYASGMTNQINKEKSVLDNHFKKIQEDAGGTVIRHGTSFQEGDKIRVGKTIKDALQEGYDAHQKGTTQLYKEAKDAFGDRTVELGKINEFLKADENFAYQNEKGLQTAINQFLRRKQFLDENNNLKPLTVAQAEEVRQFINSKYHHETKQLGGQLKGLIDNDVFESVGGETFEKARKHYQKGIEVYDNPKAVGDLLGDNGVNQKIPDEKVAAKVVTLPNSQFEHLFNTLESDGQIGAVNQIKTSLVEQIREAGNSAKDQPFNSVAAAKEAAKLSEKLKIAYKNDPKGLEAIYDGIEAADILYIPNKYPGAGVQTNLLQNKFMDVGIRRAFGSAGGALGSAAGPLGAAGGAVVGESVGAKVSGKVSESKQKKALKKEIKPKSENKTSLKDIYELKD